MSRPIDSQSLQQRRQRSDRDVVYVGYRQRRRTVVEKLPDQERLTPRRSLKLANHSPSGFEWGYGGSGPAQLALALLLDYTEIEAEMVDGRAVIPLQETVAFANEYYATFESALDMLTGMYDDVDTDATYRMG